MKYTKDQWRKRIHLRSDISGSITHLTRENSETSAIDVLIKILSEKRLIGSSPEMGFIIGDTKAVCFQDAPIYGLTQNLINEQYSRSELGNKIRYRGIGLGFSKKYAFIKGARPVFYETKDMAKSIIPASEWWRIVSFDLSDDQNIVDWTHEREWRVKGDFCFDLNETYVYLVNQSSYQAFMERAGTEIINGIKGIVVLDPVLT